MRVEDPAPKKNWKSYLSSSRGANLVEVAAVVPLLLLLTFAIVDFSTLFYVYLSLENGVSQATRYGITGQQMDNPSQSGQKLSREDSIKTAMRQATPNIAIDDSAFVFEHLQNTSWVGGSGGPNEIMRLTVNYRWHLMTPLVRPFFRNGQINLRVTSTMKIESYPTS